MRLTVDTLIASRRERVWQRLVDIPHWSGNVSAIRKIEMLTTGPVAVGSRFRETRIMHGREASEEMTVAELEPPTRFVLTAESHGARYRATHRLAEEAGGTRLTLEFEGRPVTALAWLLYPLGLMMVGSVRKQITADLADLKRACEAT